MDEQLESLRQYVEDNGGEVLYEDFVAQVEGPARVNIINAARGRFRFSLRVVDGNLQHFVSLKS